MEAAVAVAVAPNKMAAACMGLTFTYCFTLSGSG